MAYQQAHTGIRKLFVGRRWSTGYIGATSCTVKRATRADLRLTPLSLSNPTLCLAALSRSISLSLSLSPSFLHSSTVRRCSFSLAAFPLPTAPLSLPLFPLTLSLYLPLSLPSRPFLVHGSFARSLARALPSSRPSLLADAATPARLTQPNPRANFIPRRLTTTDGRRRPRRRRRRRHRTRVTRHAVSTSLPCVRAFGFFAALLSSNVLYIYIYICIYIYVYIYTYISISLGSRRVRGKKREG